MNGSPALIRNPTDAKRLGISMIPQEFNLIDTLKVYENIFLGNEIKVRGPFLDKSSMVKKTREILTELNAGSIDPESFISNLSVAQKQMVEIGKALNHESNLLIMDEPTTVLNSEEVQLLFTLVRKIKAKGVSIIFISHKLREVKEICDEVLILRDGKQIQCTSTDGLEIDDMVKGMVGRDMSQIFPDKLPPADKVYFSVRNLSVPGLIQDISFDLKKGEILGFAGLMGAGRTETAETIMGLRKKSAGRYTLDGNEIEINTPEDAIKNRIAYLSEDRQKKGIILNFGIPQNISLISLKKYIRGLINSKKEQDAADVYVRKFNIKSASLKSQLRYLSGGNQQKVYLAKWMDTNPDILILDEPTRGIDVNARLEIYQFIQNLAKNGISCIVISSELEEVIGLCSRVIVMKDGKISGELSEDQLNEEDIMFYATGIKEGEKAV
ncbi:MAG: sugar ABC transporter ATP-binding protein [Spirochaetales bacterium]|nr:sugar ABC transporter ATP-binding protein [Spirochaetales bacterium]